MKKIVIEVQRATKITVEVEFPYYYSYSDCFDHGGGYDVVVRIEEDGSALSIQNTYGTHREDEWEVEAVKLDTNTYGGYIESKRGSRSAKEEFDNMRALFLKFVAEKVQS